MGRLQILLFTDNTILSKQVIKQLTVTSEGNVTDNNARLVNISTVKQVSNSRKKATYVFEM